MNTYTIFDEHQCLLLYNIGTCINFITYQTYYNQLLKQLNVPDINMKMNIFKKVLCYSL